MQRIELLPYQSTMMNAPYVFDDKIIFFLSGGYGSGKTSCLIYNLLERVSALQGRVDSSGEGARIILASSTITFMKQTSLLTLESILKKTGSIYKWDKNSNIITIGTVTIIVKPCEDPENIYGVDVHSIFWDEMDELPTEISMRAFERLMQRMRQKIIGFRPPLAQIYSTAQGLSGMYNKYIDLKKTKTNFFLLRAWTKDNIYLPKETVDLLYASMSRNRQRAELEGEFISDNTYNVFAEYDRARHLLKEDFYPLFLDEEGEYARTRIYIGQDFNGKKIGNNAVAAAVIDGALIYIKDYNIENPSEAPMIFRKDFPTQEIIWIPDVTYQGLDAVRMIFTSPPYRIKVAIGKNPNVTARVFAANTLFHLDKMFICPVCERLEKAVLLHRYDRSGDISKGGIGAPDHLTDCMCYIEAYVLEHDPAFYDIFKITMGRHLLWNPESENYSNGESMILKRSG